MKKRNTLIIITLFLTILTYWAIEPLTINPFNKITPPLTESEINFECDNSEDYTLRFKSKADSLLDKAILSNDFLGVTIGLYKAGCGTWIGGAGFSSKKDQKRVNGNMLNRIASISKPMTALAIMKLYEESKIDLDVPIQTYLEEFPIKKEGKITIRQLLKHTSGLPNYSSNWEGFTYTHYPTLIKAIEHFKDKDLVFKPEADFLYSPYGYTVLGAIIEKVSGQSYEEYMVNNIWRKAGMKNTSLEHRDKIYDNKARLYLKVKSNYIRAPYNDLSLTYSGGGIQSTAFDLLELGKAILENKLIDSTTFDLMISSTDSLKAGTPYGFGWYVQNDPKYGRIIYHGGSQSGTSAYFRIYLDEKIIVSVLTNNSFSGYDTRFLAKDISSLALDSIKLDLPIINFKKDTSSIASWL